MIEELSIHYVYMHVSCLFIYLIYIKLYMCTCMDTYMYACVFIYIYIYMCEFYQETQSNPVQSFYFGSHENLVTTAFDKREQMREFTTRHLNLGLQKPVFNRNLKSLCWIFLMIQHLSISRPNQNSNLISNCIAFIMPIY